MLTANSRNLSSLRCEFLFALPMWHKCEWITCGWYWWLYRSHTPIWNFRMDEYWYLSIRNTRNQHLWFNFDGPSHDLIVQTIHFSWDGIIVLHRNDWFIYNHVCLFFWNNEHVESITTSRNILRNTQHDYMPGCSLLRLQNRNFHDVMDNILSSAMRAFFAVSLGTMIWFGTEPSRIFSKTSRR